MSVFLVQHLVVLNVFYGDYTHRSCPWYNSAVWQVQMDMVVFVPKATGVVGIMWPL